jgi:hypothetical protein
MRTEAGAAMMNRLLPKEYQTSETAGRRTGKTTAIALRAISDAIANPGRRVPLIDHFYPDQRRADRHLADMARAYIHMLGLQFMTVKEAERRDRAPPNTGVSFIVVSEHMNG